MNAAALDAVTLDAHGTLMQLRDPVPALLGALAARGVERSAEAVRTGFLAEVAHYAPRASDGHDEESLARLQHECADVFLDTVDAELDVDEFTPVFVASLQFELLPGAFESLERLRALGLALAVVANWDLSLHRLLDEVGVTRYFAAIVHAARKPEPDGLVQALEALRIEPARALHIGDDDADARAAAAAGMHFARAPLPDVVSSLV